MPLKLLLLLLPALLLPACAPSAARRASLPVPATVEVVPAVAHIRTSLDRASQSASELSAGTAALTRTAADAREGASKLAEATRRIADHGTASPVELADVAARAESQSALAARLAGDLAASRKTTDDLTGALGQARAAQAEALQAASSGDAAQHLLTGQVQALARQYESAQAAVETLQPQLAVKSARITRLTRWLTGLTLACTIYLAARLLKLTPYARPFLFWLP